MTTAKSLKKTKTTKQKNMTPQRTTIVLRRSKDDFVRLINFWKSRDSLPCAALVQSLNGVTTLKVRHKAGHRTIR